MASAAQARSLKRVGSANNLAPPTMAISSHLSRSLPPSPQHSPAGSRKVMIERVNLLTALQIHCLLLLTRLLLNLGSGEVMICVFQESVFCNDLFVVILSGHDISLKDIGGCGKL